MFERTIKPRRFDVEKLKNLIQLKASPMVERNCTRQDFLLKFQSLIEEYGNGAYTAEHF